MAHPATTTTWPSSRAIPVMGVRQTGSRAATAARAGSPGSPGCSRRGSVAGGPGGEVAPGGRVSSEIAARRVRPRPPPGRADGRSASAAPSARRSDAPQSEAPQTMRPDSSATPVSSITCWPVAGSPDPVNRVGQLLAAQVPLLDLPRPGCRPTRPAWSDPCPAVPRRAQHVRAEHLTGLQRCLEPTLAQSIPSHPSSDGPGRLGRVLGLDGRAASRPRLRPSRAADRPGAGRAAAAGRSRERCRPTTPCPSSRG